ncbi:RNA-binding protein 5-like isoform X2 [Coccinella septempunctata]|uniref:RNA-binding protein 5-like isoform X2 n=1 Tax=Coccinella septempunctata TaxID=41139 RepID=UPI001D0811C1|nr:RNA-binding protein 5-like isoform X2 [Coccinella septempunctata]
MDRMRERDYSPYGRRSMSISPDYRRDSPDYRPSRSSSRSPHQRRHNGYRNSPYHPVKKNYHDHNEGRSRGSDYESDREYRRERESSYEERSHSRSPDGRDSRSRYHRNREHRRGRNRRSRSDSRWERKSEEGKNRDRDRSYRDDDSDSERSPNGAVLGASGAEIIGYKSQPPNNTIMIRGLAQHITENDIRQDIMLCGLMPKDIRLIRKKDTGASRGFAFVEFTTLAEATRWMDMKQGVLMLQDQYRAIMQYSIPKDMSFGYEKPPNHKASADWFCIKCGAQNFRRRDNCFKCHASRMESEEGGSGSDEICTYATKTIMLRNLDALTTEDSVMGVLKSVVPDLVNSIAAVTIGRDPLTSTSRGICYLGLESTIDSLTLYGALSNLSSPLVIDGKTVILSYCKYQMGDNKRAYSEAENVAFPNAAIPSTYAMTDVDSLAEYAANRYAKTPQEYIHYVMYYKEYFTQQISAGNSITLHQDNQMDAANAAAAVAQSAIQQVNATKSMYDTSQRTIPTGVDGKRYPIPDISKYVLDKTSNYQFDPSTGLYFDSQTGYYWNPLLQIYLYWDPEKQTYVRADSMEQYSTQQVSVQNSTVQTSTSGEPENKKQKPEKQDKVKVAKKIAKDMERWAKTLNQKKEICASKANYDMHNNNGSSASADIGFSVLEKKVNMNTTVYQKEVPEEAEPIPHGPLVAAYGGESESSGDEEHFDENELLDFKKLICNLCKRQLGSTEALAKHAQLSNLHKQNLEAIRKLRKSEASEKIVYRDRAKERRMKYGNPDEPRPSKLKEKFLKSKELTDIPVAASVLEPIGAENVGNKLLQKMGWTEGQGLGKLNQGRTTIIQAEHRSNSAGLGNTLPGYNAVAGESYKDCVKKMMYARYQELTEKENST